MTWTTFHHRGEVLRTVTRAADDRRDGLLPMDVAGVRETFGDELTLLGALQLRWHTRLSGHVESELQHEPMSPADAVVRAWHAAADELPGTRAIIDHYREAPLDPEMENAVTRAAAKERLLLAAMAGLAGADTRSTVELGRGLEEQARASYAGTSPSAGTRHRGHGLVDRILARASA